MDYINATKTTELIVRLSGVFDDYNGPLYGGSAMYNLIMKSNPVLFPAQIIIISHLIIIWIQFT